MYDCIIIGAGPAGLTSALYLRRANKKVLLLDSKGYGGQIINASKIENYPSIKLISGFEFATNLYNQVIDLGAEAKIETVLKIEDDKTVITNNNNYKTKSIIIANGVQNRKLNLPNENKLLGKGISYCATCDGNFFKNKIVAVNGGGNTAIEDAIYLSSIATKVYLIHRRDEFKAEQKYIDEIKKIPNVEIITNSNITSINGDIKLESITLNNNKNIDVDGLFIAIGQIPNNNIFNNIVDIDEYGYIISNNEVNTKTNGIFVAGDTRQKELRQIVTATSDGAIAASSVIKYLS